jgi:hypothetical protein
MSLSEKLDAIRAGAEKQIPPPALELMHRATQELEDSGATKRVIAVGSALPDFTLTNQHGEPVSSASLLGTGPLVLTVYRGLW